MTPLILVTGFLGSGKTTLIRHFLAHPGCGDSLVIVNEFGEVGIDHALLEASSDDTLLLANGCLCCTIRGNLVDTLNDVDAQRRAGRIGGFSRVIVETSGVADPAALLGFLAQEGGITDRYRLAGVVTVVSARDGGETIAAHDEAARQVAVADRLILSKTDITAPGATAALVAALRRANPTAEILTAVQGEIDPAVLLADGAAGWWRAAPPACDHDHAHPHHAARFEAITFSLPQPWPAGRVAALIGRLAQAGGPTLLRVKLLCRDADGPGWIEQHAAMGHVAPPVTWRQAPPATLGEAAGRGVVICDGPVSAAVFAVLAAAGATR